MQKILLSLFLLLYLWPGGLSAADTRFANLREGDLIFQPLQGGQNTYIALATRSIYTHCGIILEHMGELCVYEALMPVNYSSLQDWVLRAPDGHYVIMRLKDEELLTPVFVADLKRAGAEFFGREYDHPFGWGDDKIYCSELIWKMYDRGPGIQLTPLRAFREFDLSNKEVVAFAILRYGYVPLDEKGVAPSDLMESPLLKVVEFR